MVKKRKPLRDITQDDLVTLLNERDKSLFEEFRNWANQQATFNEKLIQESRNLFQLNEVTHIIAGNGLTVGGVYLTVFTFPVDATLHFIVHSNNAGTNIRFRRLGADTSRTKHIYYGWLPSNRQFNVEYGKIGIDFKEGESFQYFSVVAAQIAAVLGVSKMPVGITNF